MSRIGEKISKARVKQGLSGKQLAKKLGVSESYISEVETGRRVINESMISKISKALGCDLNDIGMSFEEEVFVDEKVIKEEKPKNLRLDSVKDVWNDAFGSVLKSVPVYRYNLRDVVTTRQMPLISNKIEGYAQDKVLFLAIEDDDMIGLRIAKGDIAFGHITHDIQNNSICLIEYNGERVIRQIKKLDSNKVLLISNRGTLRTDTANVKDITVLVKLDRLEIIL